MDKSQLGPRLPAASRGKGDGGEEFEFDISDTLVESDSDVYVSNFDDDESGNVSSDYYDKINGKITRNWNDVGNGGMVSRNNLERAVLMPSQEEGAVYFSPSQEKEGQRKENEDKERSMSREYAKQLVRIMQWCEV